MLYCYIINFKKYLQKRLFFQTAFSTSNTKLIYIDGSSGVLELLNLSSDEYG